MKVIIDTNLWISFLIGHQTQLVRRMLTDMRFDVFVCARLVEEIRDVATRNKIRKYES
ncbi:MAG: putative toxin-antitoxin system toxin component, PIN family [Bacteroidales bacterium]|nr:putative toxin-antitoxin system toxin component, PIN family [Bacteroidales bacterium]